MCIDNTSLYTFIIYMDGAFGVHTQYINDN